MLKNFEEYTYPINDFERGVAKFIKKVGLGEITDFPGLTKNNPTNTKPLCSKLSQRFGIKITEDRLRQIINYLRRNEFPVLYQTKKESIGQKGGYYISWNLQDIMDNADSLNGRAAGVYVAAKGLDSLSERIKSGQIKVPGSQPSHSQDLEEWGL